MADSSWIRRLGPAAPGRPRLVVLPHAGAGAFPFRPWVAPLAARAELWVVIPPGRETRLGEPPLREWAPWLDGAAAGLARVAAEGPYALFGHSLGALAAYSLTRRFAASGGVAQPPCHLIVSGCRPPAAMRWDDPDALDDAALIARIRDLGGTPPEILESEEIMALVLPALRADFKLAATWTDPGGTPLGLPITALAGLADPAAPPAEVRGWLAHTRGPATLSIFPGDHFFPFVDGAPPSLLDLLVSAADG